MPGDLISDPTTPPSTIGDRVVLTDFTSLVQTWQTTFGSRGFLYDSASAVGVPLEGWDPPAHLAFGPCSPNPFNSQTFIRYSLSQPSQIRLAVFDVRGRQVALLADGQQTAGSHEARWNAAGMASGLYFCRLEQREVVGAPKERTASRRLVLIR